MNRGFFHTVALFGLLLLAASCSNYQKLLKSNDVDQKYKAALSYYEKGDYNRANLLLEQVLPLLSGRPEAEAAKFYYADSYFKQGDYILAAYHFQSFFETYQRSELAERAMFLYAKSQFNQSPTHEQDQASTLTALEALQEFQIRYPESEFSGEANQMNEDLFRKLDQKAFNSARLYYQLRYFKSAVVAFTNFQRENPSSPFVEEALYLRLDAQHRYAKESIFSKQEERFTEAVDFYQAFVDQYPNSRFLRSAEQVYESSLAELQKLKSNNNISQTN